MITRRGLEIATAALTGAFGAAVVVSSIEIGSGWSTGGVEAGTFPFVTGLLICAGSAVNLGASFLGENARILTRPELGRMAGLFLPALAMVVLIPWIGMYAASGGYLLFSLGVQHRLPLWRTLLITAVTLAGLYLIFEWTFQVPLPRGRLDRALGF
jgi:hypothetical protein